MVSFPKLLKDRPFSAAEAQEAGLSRYALGKLMNEGVIEQLARGVYRMTGSDISEEDQFRIATLRVGSPSAICLVSALAHYGLTDVIPKKTWVMVPNTKRTSSSGLQLLRTRNPEWSIGIEARDGYSITTLDRTIVEALTYPEKLGTRIGVEALRKAIVSKQTTPGRILDLARKLGVAHRVRSYIEVLT